MEHLKAATRSRLRSNQRSAGKVMDLAKGNATGASDRVPDDAEGHLTDDFRNAMRRLSAGVAIVCSSGEAGWVGLTATSVSSLSMDPPSLLVCINRNSSLRPALTVGNPFSVSLLARQHIEVSKVFGGAAFGADRFRVGDWEGRAIGVPVLKDAIAQIESVVDLEVEYGSHTIIIGRVSHCRSSLADEPLVYVDGAYV